MAGQYAAEKGLTAAAQGAQSRTVLNSDMVAPFGTRWAANWLRWGLWILFLGVGFHGAQLIILTLHGMLLQAIAIFVTGVIGYVFTGFLLGAVVALVATSLPRIAILPTSVLGGILRTGVIGFIIGIATSGTGIVQYMISHPSSDESSRAANTEIDQAFTSLQSCKGDIHNVFVTRGQNSQAVHLAYSDCDTAATGFAAMEHSKQYAALGARQRDELSFSEAYALFGRAGAEMRIGDLVASRTDFADSRSRLTLIIQHDEDSAITSKAQTLLDNIP